MIVLVLRRDFFYRNDVADLKIVSKMRRKPKKKEFYCDIPETRKLVICVSSVTE